MTSSQNFDIENQHGLEKNDRTSDLKEQLHILGGNQSQRNKVLRGQWSCIHCFMAICIHMHVVICSICTMSNQIFICRYRYRNIYVYIYIYVAIPIYTVSVIKLARSSKIIRFFKSQPMRTPDDFRSVFKLCS